jgi:hypothetical protein
VGEAVRATEKIALEIVRAGIAQKAMLGFGFHAFDDAPSSEATDHIEDSLDHSLTVGVLIDPADEPHVDLDVVRTQHREKV